MFLTMFMPYLCILYACDGYLRVVILWVTMDVKLYLGHFHVYVQQLFIYLLKITYNET
jgi:hypothetical protein